MTESVYVGRDNYFEPLVGWVGSIIVNGMTDFGLLELDLYENYFVAKKLRCFTETSDILIHYKDRNIQILLHEICPYNLKTNLDIPYPLDTLTLSGVQFTECSQPSILPGRRMMIAGYLKGTYKGISYT